jgi:hypothetical protein
MPKTPRRTGLVREPVQVYLAPDDSALLNRLAEETGLSKAELLRRGIKSYAREQQGAVAPMLRFLAESSAGSWPSDVAVDHDAALADSYRTAAPKKRR